ncbi:NUDIX domain-containing protein [Nocardiopsis metallicus]|uniref:ADP-ribose pyrophosphatase YjhB (NUDIX family) n=1 Tax=Nocardiopsis metallicus TaxID=179819 RepID=A0A840WB32_9ACTN|nr:NUDIX hydrolase [Nocardiopsis metallicus]MBB5488987.1 ADP-ribose pyrophosphatase YjhB (NUDIX family) [Nocardiopsis metallicus]
MSYQSDEEFFANLPATRGAAGGLIRSGTGDVLLVRRVYAPEEPWGIPGGMMEAEESPLTACRREIAEELGVTARVLALLVVDWVPAQPPRTTACQWLFRVDTDSTDFRLQPDELSAWKWVPPAELPEHLPARVARRMLAAVAADDDRSGPVYLEHGRAVLPGLT